MSDTELRTRLQQMIAELDAEAGSEQRSDAVALDQTRVGRLSRMDALQQQEMRDADRRRAEALRRRLRKALLRLDEGIYGICEDCDEPIAAARLRADPAAERCIVCAARREEQDT